MRALGADGDIGFQGPAGSEHKFTLEAGTKLGRMSLLDGDYPRWQNLLSGFAATHTAQLDASELLGVVKRVSTVADARAVVTLTFDPVGEVNVTVENDNNAAEEAAACSWSGEETFTIGFSASVLIDALNMFAGSSGTFNVSTPTKPILLTAEEEVGEYSHLLMPLRV